MPKHYFHGRNASGKTLKKMEPAGFYEKVKESGCPEGMYGADNYLVGFQTSDVKESSFSKTLVGAIMGTIQGFSGEGGRIAIFRTSEKPDVDISDCGYDFSAFREVRFRRTVPVERVLILEFDAGFSKQLMSCYGEGSAPGSECLSCVEKGLRKQLGAGSRHIKALDQEYMDRCYARELGVTYEQMQDIIKKGGESGLWKEEWGG